MKLIEKRSMTLSNFNFTSMTPVEKGWSCDKKYCVTTGSGEKYLLRVSPEDRAGHIEMMFRMMQQVEDKDVPMCRPIEFGTCEQGIYTLQTWIDGRDGEELIPGLSDSDQYEFGLEAGRILKLIHSVPTPDSQPDWEERFNVKMDTKISMYKECSIGFRGAEKVIGFLEENRHLLANRPQCFQHGDYHIGNMMIENNRLIIIDFDRCDFGDPWEEFNRIVWSAQASPLFASGIVDGYFDNNVPQEFWRLLALYIGSNLLGSLPWAVQFGEDEVKTMLGQAEQVLNWYDDMNRIVPAWYKDKVCPA